MCPDNPSNIFVFMYWHDQTILAGEDIKCTITLKNVTCDASWSLDGCHKT